jgi:hypothetical protein
MRDTQPRACVYRNAFIRARPCKISLPPRKEARQDGQLLLETRHSVASALRPCAHCHYFVLLHCTCCKCLICERPFLFHASIFSIYLAPTNSARSFAMIGTYIIDRAIEQRSTTLSPPPPPPPPPPSLTVNVVPVEHRSTDR